jgi:hypothetical protein
MMMGVAIEHGVAGCRWSLAEMVASRVASMCAMVMTTCAWEDCSRGAWEGKAKSGLGVYKWPSQARYAGQWLNNNKHGSGIYSYPKGGIYKVRQI